MVQKKSLKLDNFIRPYQIPPPKRFGTANYFSPFEAVFEIQRRSKIENSPDIFGFRTRVCSFTNDKF